jgi:two-component system sensor histidine kinase YesM
VIICFDGQFFYPGILFIILFAFYQHFKTIQKFIKHSDNNIVPVGYAGLPEVFEPDNLSDDNIIMQDDFIYRIQSLPLSYADLTLYSRTDITFLSEDANAILFTTAVVTISSFLTALILAILLGHIITKPLNRLTGHLKRLSENDFTCDPMIEKGGDEIAEMGHVVNEMTNSINLLLHETEEMYLRQKNSDIALLQSQVNPHFLYNTLDSIRWMAVIQKNTGIEKTVHSLSNLLKNLAKGVSDKITLAEELSLLKDYMEIQSVRFMELLEFEDRVPVHLRHFDIVKFTLQPLVENAIFHGIIPTGKFGKIIVDAKEEDEYLLVFIEDNGMGMTPYELADIFTLPNKPHTRGMAGIGIANVDERMKLVYGNECGISFESEHGVFTRVTVRIRKEVADVQNPVS